MLRRLFSTTLSLALLAGASHLAAAEAQQAQHPAATPKIAIVDFKRCVESSKLGKQQQASFQGLKDQMEALLEEKEKSLHEINNKLNDPDYIDGLTAEAENELKYKYRSLVQDYTQSQQQCMQGLQQANAKILQLVAEEVGKASKEYAETSGFDAILSNDSSFYCKDCFDVSEAVIGKMNENFERDLKKKELDGQKDPLKAKMESKKL